MAECEQNLPRILSVTLNTMQKTAVQCIGFIMDGNRRWAKERNLPTLEGHRQGAAIFNETVRWVAEARIPHAVYYAFSTENWKRSEEEVEYLMELFQVWLRDIERELSDTPVRVRIVGHKKDFSEGLQRQMRALEKRGEEKEGAHTTIWVALSYGGRAEIVSAVNEAVARGEQVTEESFEKLLWTAEMPDPDIVVRTGGEQRLSNFMTWKSVYSELLFLDKHWPALTKDDFAGILMQYEKRERRRGA